MKRGKLGVGEVFAAALQGAILGVKLRHLERWTEARRAHAAAYSRLLAATGLKLPVERPGCRHVFHLYTVRTPHRDRLRAALEAEGKVLEGVKVCLVNGKEPVAIGALEARPYTVPHDAREPVQYILSDGNARLGVLTDIGASTAHVEQSLSGLDALVLECNYDLDMLWAGPYPKWLKSRIAGPFGHLDNRQSEGLLGRLERSKLKHVLGAHLSQHNNTPALARAALARALGCSDDWIGIASQDEGSDWRSL